MASLLLPVITELIDFLTALSPALCGAIVGLAVAAKYSRGAPGVTAVLCGVGGVLGYLLLALFIRWQDARGVAVLTSALDHVLLVLPFVLVFLCVVLWRKSGALLSPPDVTSNPEEAFWIFHRVLPLLSSLLFFGVFYQSVVSPVSSWDGLGLWTTWADFFLQFDLDPEGFRGRTREEHGTFPLSHPRHPPTLYHISALSGFALNEANLIRGWLAPWSAAWLCGALAVWGVIRELSGSNGIALLGTYAYATLPLLENHAILVGYADLWVAVLVTLAVACSTLALVNGRRLLWVLALILTPSVLLLKNTGMLYLLAVVLPLVTVLLGRWSPKLLISLVLIFLPLAIWLYLNGFSIDIVGLKVALEYGDSGKIVFGGKSMTFSRFPVLGILQNEVWALVVNQSFSLVGVVLFLAVVLATQKTSFACARERHAFIYLLGAALGLIIFFMLPQLTVDYAQRYAAPTSDTGNSRFLLAVGPVVIMSLGLLVKVRACGNKVFSRGT